MSDNIGSGHTLSAGLQATSAQAAQAQATGHDDSIQCEWRGCGERFPAAEQLYEHVCERHVGRKSTNNLNLTCAWPGCSTTTVKRDHITSHIRVHIPLKPHRCDFCGKSFKRPQDLKKHVKTHADDSVLLHTPEPPHPAQNPNPTYPNPDGTAQHLQALAAAGAVYSYDSSGQGSNMGHHGYGNQGPSNPSYYGNQGQSFFGPVHYNQGHQAAMDTRKRGNEALDDFCTDVKRRHIDPQSNADVSRRVLALQGVEMPVLGATAAYQAAPAMVGVNGHEHGPAVQSHYALPPLHNLRTKNDLVNMEQFLDQAMSTVYRNATSNRHAQPVYVDTSMTFPQDASSTGAQAASGEMDSMAATAGGSHAAGMAATSSNDVTPGLTPPSTTISHASTHSPSSMTASHGLSPLPPSMGGYPSLPGVSAADEMTETYPAPSSRAPTATLGSSLDPEQQRRYSSGMLQKASKPLPSDEMDLSEGQHLTLVNDSLMSTDGTYESKGTAVDFSTSSIDPALSHLSSPGQQSSASDNESVVDAAGGSWVESIRTMETIKAWVQDLLNRHAYVDEKDKESEESSVLAHLAHDLSGHNLNDLTDHLSEHQHQPQPYSPSQFDGTHEMMMREATQQEKEAENLYPILHAVEAAS
ncbi:MAG: hypothetical protein M1838_002542 [Thelocarpon superellum]|nr:MAG: hypothetical protein M1838_002542 [Thelocarpon superellum]